MRRKKKKHIDPENSDRWLLTYADLITLLLGLFVILYAMSKIDVVKYSQVVTALGGVFGGDNPGGILDGSTKILPPEISTLQDQRSKIQREVQQAIGGMTQQGFISFSQNERGITVHLMEKFLFNSGSADLKESSFGILDTLSFVLKRLPNDIRIEGHTDNVPIQNDRFPSNWHLSISRALNTGYYMIKKYKLNPEKVSVVGYSEYHPLMPNTTEINRALNRRVDIVIVTTVVNGKTPVKDTSTVLQSSEVL